MVRVGDGMGVGTIVAFSVDMASEILTIAAGGFVGMGVADGKGVMAGAIAS